MLAAAHIGALTSNNKIISFDMGGTTAKAGLIEGNAPRIVSRFQAGEWLLGVAFSRSGGNRFRRRQHRLDRCERHDESGTAESAGADPGPACYARGGADPTVTDADLVLGWLNADFFLGGQMPLKLDAARQAVETRIAKPLGLDPVIAADGIVKIVNSQMVEALRLVTVARGEDPRAYAMVAFGGCGPVHAAEIGRGKCGLPE